MTRDEAKKEWANTHPLDLDLDSVIDVIYDDFENRVCENCKHYLRGEGCELTYWQDYSSGYGFECEENDFCSKWESK